MARHYSTREFFRQMPNALLVRYFGERRLFADLDFAGMAETKPSALVEAWLALPDEIRRPMAADFQDIFELSGDGGFQAIIDEADWQYQGKPADRAALVEKLAALPGHFERAMVTFLDHQELWRGAVQFHHADSLAYWRKRRGLPKVAADLDRNTRRVLADRIGEYFRHAEGRGRHCIVEALRRGKRDYFFAYPEDYSQQSVEWDGGAFARRPHNPAFEVIFVYRQDEGSLDVNCRGATKATEAMQAIFAEVILKVAGLAPPARDDRVYDLDPLLDRNFEFNGLRSNDVFDVRLRKLRLSSRVRKGDRLTLEADTGALPHAIHDLLDKLRLPLAQYSVTMVELTVRAESGQGKRPKAVTFRLTHPNSCSLKYDEVGVRLRRMLGESGIEPRARAVGAGGQRDEDDGE